MHSCHPREIMGDIQEQQAVPHSLVSCMTFGEQANTAADKARPVER